MGKVELRVCVPFCTFLILNYRDDRPPISHFDWIEDDRLNVTYHAQYLTGAYRLDPYFQLAMGSFRPGFFRLQDIAPDRFYASEYYRRYYQQTELCDEVGMLTRQSDGSVSAISISRDVRHGPFRKTELTFWRTISPVLTELLWQHCEATLAAVDGMLQPAPVDTSTLIHRFCQGHAQLRLTKRESEIAALVLQGHSTLSASALLGLSPGTVKVHRKNIYRKLGISSQAELFTMLHGALNSRQWRSRPGA